MLDAAILAQIPVRDSGFFDPLYLAFLSGDRFLASRFPCSYTRSECWSDWVARRRGAKAPDALWAEWAAANERWGAPAASKRALARLAEGTAVAVVTGQQPDALGGPLFTLHKTATAVALAKRVEARTGTPAVAVFWSANEDSDFEEIRTVRVFGPALEPHEISLPDSARVPSRMVGHIPAGDVGEAWEEAIAAWRGLPGGPLVAEWIARARERSRDLADVQATLLLSALGDEGLVVLDPRMPAFRRAARPLYERYVERQEQVREKVESAGRALEEAGYARAIQSPQSEFSLFAARQGTRVKLDPESARVALAQNEELSPNVVLRPVVQDAILPSIFLVAGPGEVAYLSQLREVYAEIDAPMAMVFPRSSATWLPPAATRLARDYGLSLWDLVRDTDHELRCLSARLLPEPLRAEFEKMRAESNERLHRFADPVRAVDASLPQLVESVRAKIDFQYGRLLEGLVTKVRTRFDRTHPEVGRLRGMLLPQGKPQERKLAWLDVVARGGRAAVTRALELAELHLDRSLAGEPAHALVSVGPDDA